MACFGGGATSQDESNAFDLTWRNYLPSVMCACLPSEQTGPIRLGDDDVDPSVLFNAPFYNDLQPDLLPSKPRRHRKKSKRRKGSKKNYTSSSQSEYDDEPYDLYTSESQDAEFLQDEHIAQILDQGKHGGGEIDGHDFYAARAVPTAFLIHDQDNWMEDETVMMPPVQEEEDGYGYDDEQNDDYDQQQQQTSMYAAAEAAQAILGERLEDLTEKLVLIRNNMMDMNKTPAGRQWRHDNGKINDDDDDDAATIHTLKTLRRHDTGASASSSRYQQHEQNDLDFPEDDLPEDDAIPSDNDNEQATASSPPIDIPTTSTMKYHTRRFSSNVTAEFPSSPNDNVQHPFSFFTQQEHAASNDDPHDQVSVDSQDNTTGLQGILNLSRWFG
ncbi:hypothetical protein BC940DRAFT_338314 [Gongronella butleri]|nr:hypothetical protein BC940DRAFT_338314 [Gongronella butleri]